MTARAGRLDPEILAEMGLAPLWVRRNGRAGEAHGAVPAATVAPVVPVAPPDAATALLDWDALATRALGCTACRLCETRSRVVFGVGVRDPEWLFVGEAPGAEEDLRGEPFVGDAGRLLDAMLRALGLDRSKQVYIANVLKCRPPGNRDPEPDEVAHCRPFLARQMELLRPRIVVALGRFAAASLLDTDATVGSLRGRGHAIELGGRAVPVVVTYHPAYLLRSPVQKKKAWADLCLAQGLLAGASQP